MIAHTLLTYVPHGMHNTHTNHFTLAEQLRTQVCNSKMKPTGEYVCMCVCDPYAMLYCRTANTSARASKFQYKPPPCSLSVLCDVIAVQLEGCL